MYEKYRDEIMAISMQKKLNLLQIIERIGTRCCTASTVYHCSLDH